MRGEDSNAASAFVKYWGSPPHARGRLILTIKLRPGGRITPACAGKTPPQLPNGGSGSGSPPHARGRLGFHCTQTTSSGITPACAGKTARRTVASTSPTDHPRMRGEDRLSWATYCSGRGSPPHARGRLPYQEIVVNPERITPACAGKTRAGLEKGNKMSDHPRMRGEDAKMLAPSVNGQGSPPHARGRLSG